MGGLSACPNGRAPVRSSAAGAIAPLPPEARGAGPTARPACPIRRGAGMHLDARRCNWMLKMQLQLTRQRQLMLGLPLTLELQL